jgi:signal transduction histidine kinase
LDTIIKSEESILHRVDCILSVCREDSVVPVSEVIKIKIWLREFTDAMRPLVESAENQFNIEDLSNINVIWSDQKMLEQILMIIIDNACKFTRNGVISFKIKPSLDEGISFIIEDTGPGISKEIRATIFDPFTRMVADDGVRREGLGLGLYIAKKLTLSLSGKISLKSQCSQGSRFIVTLPIQANSLVFQ